MCFSAKGFYWPKNYHETKKKKNYFFLPVACADIGLPLGRRCPLYRKAGSGHLSAQETQLVMVVAFTAVLAGQTKTHKYKHK